MLYCHGANCNVLFNDLLALYFLFGLHWSPSHNFISCFTWAEHYLMFSHYLSVRYSNFTYNLIFDYVKTNSNDIDLWQCCLQSLIGWNEKRHYLFIYQQQLYSFFVVNWQYFWACFFCMTSHFNASQYQSESNQKLKPILIHYFDPDREYAFLPIGIELIWANSQQELSTPEKIRFVE